MSQVWHLVWWLWHLYNFTFTKKNVSRSMILGKFPSFPKMSHMRHISKVPGDHFWSSFWFSNKQHYLSKVPIRIHERFLQIILKFAKCGPPCEGRRKWIMDYGTLRLELTLKREIFGGTRFIYFEFVSNIWSWRHEFEFWRYIFEF